MLIKKWTCANIACETLKIPNSNMYKHLNKEYGRNSIKGFKWSYNKEDLFLKSIEKNNFKSPLHQYDLNGNFIKEWNSILKASTELNLNRAGIYVHLKGNSKSIGNFIFKLKTYDHL